MKINKRRLMTMLDEVNQITSESEGVTRLAYSEQEEVALDWFIDKCEAHGIRTYRDAIGNVFGTIGPKDGKGVLIGSHLDTVKDGGKYDGALGVMAGLEVLMTLTENHVELKRSVTVVSFRGEEANILGGTFGSRAFCGMIDFNDDFVDRLKRTPFSLQQVKDTMNVDQYSDYIELHIEQGKSLEKDNINIGIVNTIAGIKRLDVIVHGESAHSGTMAMTERDDALTHTAGILLRFEKIVKTYDARNVGTVGELFVHPNLPNVVPGKVEFVLEVRGTNIETVRDITDEISNYARLNHHVTIKPNVEKHPSNLSETLLAAAEEACREIDMSYCVMMSGANHDANSLSTIINSGLIFIPCLNGVSHNPKEYAAPTDIENGANTLLGTIMKLV